MNLEVEGKLIKTLALQTGQGQKGTWQKQDFVLETEDKFPKKVCFSAWGDKTDEIKRFQIGDKLKVSFNPESREYNEKWYTELRAWKIENSGAANKQTGSNTPPPFGIDDIPPADEEDLPF
jgi:hypothetical protein